MPILASGMSNNAASMEAARDASLFDLVSLTARAAEQTIVRTSSTLGSFLRRENLTGVERELVDIACAAADNAYIPRSQFPVGSAILAQNAAGHSRIFRGCNVENRFLPATICAERNAVTTAIAEGYSRFLAVAVFAKKHPGGSPCGLCRQMLNEFGGQAILLNVCDVDHNVYRSTVGELLPAAGALRIAHDWLSEGDRLLADEVLALRAKAYVPYSKAPRAAIFIAGDAEGRVGYFTGVSDDNASYGGSALAECVAMRNARTAGYSRNVTLVATVGPDAGASNPIEGEALQVLREFGMGAQVILVADDGSIVESSVDELFPDSFGPEALT